ncbi:hypothetical protein Z945_1430 [Sulfitobacter noctilucae]|nr:hypothetical protein Z945_1430 [Sulfitobacter noctilucae]
MKKFALRKTDQLPEISKSFCYSVQQKSLLIANIHRSPTQNTGAE